jgi:hypothetical protein
VVLAWDGIYGLRHYLFGLVCASIQLLPFGDQAHRNLVDGSRVYDAGAFVGIFPRLLLSLPNIFFAMSLLRLGKAFVKASD